LYAAYREQDVASSSAPGPGEALALALVSTTGRDNMTTLFAFVMVFLAARHAGKAKGGREYGKNGCSAINRIYELQSFFLPNLNIRSGQKSAAHHQKSKHARLEWFSFTSKLETLISFLSVDTGP